MISKTDRPMRPLSASSRMIVGLFTFVALSLIVSSCVYKFTTASIPPEVRTVKITTIENHARYINTQLSPKLTDRLRQKVVSQTRLTQTNRDSVDWEITGAITDYSFSTSAISNQQSATNRLTVSVHVTLNDHTKDKVTEYDVTHSFDFKADLSFQQAENLLGDEIVRTMTDEIFNRLFSNW